MRFYWNAKCEIWNRACRIDLWQKQLCIFITRMSILIFVRVLENSSHRAYFRSCDENTATPLADKREIGRFMGFPVPYWKIWLVCFSGQNLVDLKSYQFLYKFRNCRYKLLIYFLLETCMQEISRELKGSLSRIWLVDNDNTKNRKFEWLMILWFSMAVEIQED